MELPRSCSCSSGGGGGGDGDGDDDYVGTTSSTLDVKFPSLPARFKASMSNRSRFKLVRLHLNDKAGEVASDRSNWPRSGDLERRDRRADGVYYQ